MKKSIFWKKHDFWKTVLFEPLKNDLKNRGLFGGQKKGSFWGVFGDSPRNRSKIALQSDLARSA
jgi:hypothetical protein